MWSGHCHEKVHDHPTAGAAEAVEAVEVETEVVAAAVAAVAAVDSPLWHCLQYRPPSR